MGRVEYCRCPMTGILRRCLWGSTVGAVGRDRRKRVRIRGKSCEEGSDGESVCLGTTGSRIRGKRDFPDECDTGSKDIIVLFGRWDAIIQVEAKTLTELSRLVIGQIRGVQGVQATETLVAAETSL